MTPAALLILIVHHPVGSLLLKIDSISFTRGLPSSEIPGPEFLYQLNLVLMEKAYFLFIFSDVDIEDHDHHDVIIKSQV